jgi:hypothetical protein
MLSEFRKNWLDIATAAIIAVIGLAVLSDVGPAFLSRVAFMSRTVPGTGVIARCDIQRESPYSEQFTPIAQFTASDGQIHEAKGETSSATCVDAAYKRAPAEVRYNPQSPSDALIGSTTDLLALGFGIVLAIQIWRRWPHRKPTPAS